MDLNKVLAELENYKNDDRDQVLAKYIEMRLTKSLNTYYKELDKNISSIYSKNELRLLKKVNSIQK